MQQIGQDSGAYEGVGVGEHCTLESYCVVCSYHSTRGLPLQPNVTVDAALRWAGTVREIERHFDGEANALPAFN